MASPQEQPRGSDVEELLAAEDALVAARRRRLALIGGAAAIAAMLWWAMGPDDDSQRVQYRTEAVARGPLVVTVSATGALQPTNQVEIGSELSGVIDTVHVDYNDRITKGQVLARLDLSKLQAEALQSQAELDVAKAGLQEKKATLAEAEAALSRLVAVRKASGGRVPSRQEMDNAEAAVARGRAAVANAQAQIELAQAKVDFDRTNLAKAEIRSPIDGVVLSREVEPGQTIAASFQAPKLFTLAESLEQMELEVDVDEADVGQVREGQDATFTVDAYPDRRFPARITQLRYASETVNNVVSYKAVLEVRNEDLALRPGMTATAEIVVATLEQATLAPNAALRFVPPRTREDDRSLLQKIVPFSRRRGGPQRSEEPKGRTRTVYRLEDGEPVAVTITTGLTDGRMTEVVEGELREGEDLIVDATPPNTQ
ncbi:MAG TPA: efflux RND transporter periplasmic adaptor subunit [Candidatus Limnocylindrales bacterium]|nr:efflux RND transporter periplasmic adaptor subunit [Candidatus Limnocylindrales bacterium]